MFQIAIKPKAEKSLKKLPKNDFDRIMVAISYLQSDPYSGKVLGGKFLGSYSIRVWPYRIVYSIFKDEKYIVIESIGHRQGVYK